MSEFLMRLGWDTAAGITLILMAIIAWMLNKYIQKVDNLESIIEQKITDKMQKVEDELNKIKELYLTEDVLNKNINVIRSTLEVQIANLAEKITDIKDTLRQIIEIHPKT